MNYLRPSVTVDIVVFTVVDNDLKVLLVERGDEPFAKTWALPGGYLNVSEKPEQDETLEEAAFRELAEECFGLPDDQHPTGDGPIYAPRLDRVYLEQLYTFGAPGRDPRGRVITVAYFALVPEDVLPPIVAGSDVTQAKWFSVEHEIPPLAFDHADILAKAVERLRGKMNYSPVAFSLVPATFTRTELRNVYVAVHGKSYDRGNFARRFDRMVVDGIISRVPGFRTTGGKQAAVFKFNRGAT